MAPDQNPGQMVGEIAAAVGSAAVAAYVRARGDAKPWSLAGISARIAEAIVCGFLAVSTAAFMEWTDPRTSVGLSAAFGLIGTEALRDFIMRLAAKRVDRE